MIDRDIVKTSKFLSKILRHSPHEIGLKLDSEGWANVEELLAKAERKGYFITFEVLEEVVEKNNKKRFAFSADKQFIRASQGHSLETVEIVFEQKEPPQFLYHGTVAEALVAIKTEGLQKMKRHHVHLSKDTETATKVGSRRGKPIILEISAGSMHASGYKFFISANGVWLTDAVPFIYIRELK